MRRASDLLLEHANWLSQRPHSVLCRWITWLPWMNTARSYFKIWGQWSISVKNTHWNDLLIDKCRNFLKLDANKPNHSWNFYLDRPGFIRGNQASNLQSTQDGRYNDQFAHSSKRPEAGDMVTHTQNRTGKCLYRNANALKYIPISKINPNWHFPQKVL